MPVPASPPPPSRPRPPSRRPRAAGGALVALGALAGAAVGFAFGQATPGFLAGLGLGVVAALLVWDRDRRG